MNDAILKSIKWNTDGLITAIAQDFKTKQVLMLAWMNDEAIQKTISEKNAWYYSRSRKKLWRKGEESGHTQKVIEIYIDCDQDAILLKVEQKGPACHTGAQSCFFTKID